MKIVKFPDKSSDSFGKFLKDSGVALVYLTVLFLILAIPIALAILVVKWIV